MLVSNFVESVSGGLYYQANMFYDVAHYYSYTQN